MSSKKYMDMVNPFVQTDETDATIKVDGHTLCLHSSILSMYSPAFKAMLSVYKDIEIHDRRAEDVIDFLKLFYPDKRQKITDENFSQFLELCEEYQVAWLYKKIEKYLLNSTKYTNMYTYNYVTYIQHNLIADQYNLKALKEKLSTTQLTLSFDKFLKIKGFDLLKKETAVTIALGRLPFVLNKNKEDETKAVTKLLEGIVKNSEQIDTKPSLLKDEPHPFSSIDFTNVSLSIGNYNIYLHSAVLCHNSPVFKAMLQGDLKEARTKHIELKDKDPKSIIEMLKFFYADKIPDLSDETNFEELLSLAQEYMVQWLTDHIEEYMMTSKKFAEGTYLDRMAALATAQKYSLSLLRSQILESCHEPIKTLSTVPNFQDLDEKTKYRLAKNSIEKNRENGQELEHSALLNFLDSYYLK